MSSMPRIRVIPVHGLGWKISGNARDRLPEPFTIALQSSGSGHWSGIVLEHKHEFEGRRVDISQRDMHRFAEVEILVEMSDGGQEITSGWGLLDLPSRANYPD